MRHPNAVAGGGAALAGGELLVEVTAAFGYQLDPRLAVLASGAIAAVVLFVGRNGLAGVWNGLLHGFKRPGA